MWELAPVFGAHLVFAEHRYFGKSVPKLRGMPNCLSYCTSANALADYAALVGHLRHSLGTSGAVIAFGGSYGGMLASWARMKYPTTFAGAIAASAPIWGFPLTKPPLDGSFQVIAHAATRAGGVDNDRCPSNLLASWVLMHELGKTSDGRSRLSDAFRLCKPLTDASAVGSLISYAQQPWFLMSEGDFPFPSTYITFAVGNNDYPMPAWPIRVACSHVGGTDFGVRIRGNLSNVTFNVEMEDGMIVNVDWDQTEVVSGGGGRRVIRRGKVDEMLSALREAIGTWYNVSGKLDCFDVENNGIRDRLSRESDGKSETIEIEFETPARRKSTGNFTDRGGFTRQEGGSPVCTGDKIPGGNAAGWGVLVCNENLNLVNSLIQGVGNDMYWPPSVATRRDAQNATALIESSLMPCADEYAKYGLYGVPATSDPWARWEDIYYGGLLGPEMSSNIFFSNGALDPWSSAGVLHNVSDSVESMLLDLGAHHLDLFFSDPEHDPPCAAEARRREKIAIQKWIGEWRKE